MIQATSPLSGLMELSREIDHLVSVTDIAKDSDLVFVIGGTGAGKSTFLNRMIGCENFRYETSSALGPTVTCDRPVFRIGHGKSSATSFPQVHFDTASQITFCDCPGFFDNRSYIQEILNTIALLRMTRTCKKVKGAILCLEYNSLLSMRGSQVDNTIRMAGNFVNSLLKTQSIFLLITKASFSNGQDPKIGIEELAQTSNAISLFYKQGNVGFFSPLDNLPKSPYVYERESIIQKINQFQLCPTDQLGSEILLSADAVGQVVDLINEATIVCKDYLRNEKYQEIASLVRLIDILEILKKNPRISQTLNLFTSTLKDQFELMQTQNEAVEKLKELQSLLPTFHTFIENLLIKIQKVEAMRKESILLQEQLQTIQAEVQKLKSDLTEFRKNPSLRKWSCVQTIKENDNVQNFESFCSLTSGKIVTGSWTGLIKIWDPTGQNYPRELRAHKLKVVSLCSLHSHGFASSSEDKSIMVWDQSFNNYTIHSDSTNFFHLICEIVNNLLAGASYNKTLSIWNTIDRRLVKKLEGFTSQIKAIGTMTEDRFALGFENSTIQIFNTRDWSCIRTLGIPAPDRTEIYPGFSKSFNIPDTSRSVRTICLLSNGTLASGGTEKAIKIWDLSSGACSKTIQMDDGCNTLCLLSDNSLVSFGFRSVKVLDPNAGTYIETITEQGKAFPVKFNDDIIVFQNNQIEIWKGSYS